MISKEVLAGLKKRYKDIHPLIFHRSVEKAKTGGELFDILDSFSHSYPLVWSEEMRCWIETEDIFQSAKFEDKGNKNEKYN